MELASLLRPFSRRRGRRLAAEPPGPLPTHSFDYEAELLCAALRRKTGGDDLEWWQSEYGRWRFEAEAKAMRRFPEFTASLSPSGRLRWRGWLKSALPRGRSYQICVTYPPTFPDEAPMVSITYPELPLDGVPHLLNGRRPCLYREGDRDGYDPARTTAATLVAWTALWIHAFETWRATGSWPGAQA